MQIDRDFGIYGFTRQDFGENDCVFSRWETPKEEKERRAEIRDDNYYGGYGDTAFYRISIPKPKTKTLTGIVIIERQSKNRYNYSAENGKAVRFGSATSLTEIRNFCSEFFKEEKGA